MATLIDMVRSVITPDILKGASSATGEQETATQNTINGAIPSVLAGALNMGSTTSGAERLSKTISDGGFGADTVNNFGKSLSDPTARQSLEHSGGNLLSSLFGSRSDAITNAIAHAGGTRPSSASTIMRFIAPLVMGVIGKQITSRGLNAGGLMNMLMGERSSILAALPPGIGRALGLDEKVHREPLREKVREHVQEPRAKTYAEPHKKRSWGPALAGALAVMALLFLLGRNRERREVTRAVEEVTRPAAMPAPPSPSIPVAPAPSGWESEVATYLSGTGPGGRSFVLEGVTFETGSSRLTPAAKAKLAVLASALKSHPNTRIRIEGHTDNQGNAMANKRLSKERADAVRAALAHEGVTSSSIETKGVGQDEPVASNSTEAGRAQNRRTALIVVKR